MTDPEVAEPAPFPKTVGERLREARLADKLDLTDVSASTRIPIRSLEAVEKGDFAGLKAPTYAVGFARAYARAVGVDEVAVARDVRVEMGGSYARTVDNDPFDAPDPSRVPPKGVMLASVLAAVLVLVAGGLWFGTSLFRGDHAPAKAPAAEAMAVPPPAPVVAPPAPVTGQVTLTANDEVWIRVYDGTGKTLRLGTMQPGDRYDVPADADRPMINVGRPDKLQVTVNGSSVAPLGDGHIAIKDVGVSAQALLARGTAAATSTVPASAVSAPGAAPARTARTIPPAFRSGDGRPRSARAETDVSDGGPRAAPVIAPGPASSSRVGADTPVTPPPTTTTP